MTVTHLASHGGAFQAGYLALALGVPTLGWILLIVGLKQRARTRPQPGARPHQLTPPARAASSGTALIVVGAALLTVGVLAIAWRL
ncbi:hypothetical protein [Mycobacterium lacus]|uniref:Uncharacterized protein n=1 Tax=Mycobacterium lacus TaxID=169765 RepID=A0A1X1Y3Y5_9MYCO|nr:hypothetical protein [Mycobacterium lacus]MCV7125341.1 hypothetical protein [Mycobacterium lacus]ORW05730.1 hypothetical protein AWC15_01560 [Mycobacterium lacus]BBX99340.1 hypothetical protein MLAC_46340 [Mycobacterium lacus]